MHGQLTLTSILERAGTVFPRTEVVSHRPDDSIHRYTYGDLYRRARSLAAVLQDSGLRPGDRVATLMWNHHMHLEAYFGIPAAGGVLHTLDPRMHAGDLLYIVTHAEDRFLIVDDVLLPVFAQIKDRVSFERVIVTRFGGGDHLPDGWEDYETLLENSAGEPVYPDLDENAPASVARLMKKMGQEFGDDLGDDFESAVDEAMAESDAPGGAGDGVAGTPESADAAGASDL